MGFHVALLVIFTACQSDSNELEDMIITDETSDNLDQDEGVSTVDYSLIESVFGDLLSLTSPFNYEAQEIPDYIDEDNTNGNSHFLLEQYVFFSWCFGITDFSSWIFILKFHIIVFQVVQELGIVSISVFIILNICFALNILLKIAPLLYWSL